jgi:hypothetical protein
MSAPDDRPWEARFLDAHPEIREKALSSPEFASWKKRLQSLVIDGEKLYVRGGDMLRDEEQILFEWALEQSLITQEMLDQGAR